ncbi:unnamed protein product [Ectocarpus sp. CCAP 1310/34]|nr:unnamed protein product [Ectocarpus sp. CCAP 1310/34]
MPLAQKLSDTNCLGATILSWWDFLVGLLRDSVGKAPDSRRVAAFSSQRRLVRPRMMQEFLRDDRTYATAVTLVKHEDEAVRRLGIVFNLVDKATWQFLADEITKVNILRVEYPTTRHQYEDAAQFVKVHPGLKGLEREVDRRNVKWRGLSLIVADASFFEFVYTLEDGYLHALKQPALFATYQGDLPAKILEVVSSATPVKMAFRRCVDSIRKEAGKGIVMRSYGVLFDLNILKWHNMLMADYAKKLSNAQKVVKQRKDKSAEKGGDKGALRERLKSMVNKKTGVRTETRMT